MEDPAEREKSLENQLAGRSQAATADEAAGAVDAADADAGGGYGIGFGYCKRHAAPGLGGMRLAYVVSDGTRRASVHVEVSGSTLATERGNRWMEEPDDELLAWVAEQLRQRA